MALPPGRNLEPGIPPRSRPQEPPCAVEDLAKLFPDDRARGRRASDGTNWCRCCDTTISTNAAFCDVHKRARNTQQQQAARSGQRPATVRVPADAIDAIVRDTDRLQLALGRATAEFNHLRNPPGWVDDLMLIAKDLTWSVDHYLRPLSNRRRLSERARRQRTRP